MSDDERPKPKSATGTMLGVPKPTVPEVATPSGTAPSDPAPDLGELAIPEARTGTGTVKGVGPRAAPPPRPQPPVPSFDAGPTAPPPSAPSKAAPTDHVDDGQDASSSSTTSPSYGEPPLDLSPVVLPGMFPSALPRRTLYMIGGGAGLVLLLGIIALATCDGDDEEAVEGADSAVEGAIPDEAGDTSGEDVEAADEDPLPVAPELTPAQTQQLERLRTEGRGRFAAGRFDDAAELYRQALEIDPSQPGLYSGLGASLARAGDTGGAIEAYSMACRLEPDSSGFHAALGRVYRTEGNAEAALAHYARALELDSNNQAAKRALNELEH